jgi:hypothetical protein
LGRNLGPPKRVLNPCPPRLTHHPPTRRSDSYYGGYAGDAKAGAGLYVFASGAAYLGAYAGGRREGHGLLALPDGGLYEGEFAGDRFEGQVGGAWAGGWGVAGRQGWGAPGPGPSGAGLQPPCQGPRQRSVCPLFLDPAPSPPPQGTYHYPDGSYYTGAWRAGRKHGPGTYWDAAGGCLRGDWAGGALTGVGAYDRPHHHFEGRFVRSVPAGALARRGAARRGAAPGDGALAPHSAGP